MSAPTYNIALASAGTPAISPGNMSRSNYIAYWGNATPVPLGVTDEITPDIKARWDDILAPGSLGKAVLGSRFISLEGTVKIHLKELQIAQIQTMLPWDASADEAGLGYRYSLTPPANSDLYQYADLLVLHDTRNAIGNATLDVWFCKAAPKTLFNVSKKGDKDDIWQMEFAVYPDRALLTVMPPALFYGAIGNATT